MPSAPLRRTEGVTGESIPVVGGPAQSQPLTASPSISEVNANIAHRAGSITAINMPVTAAMKPSRIQIPPFPQSAMNYHPTQPPQGGRGGYNNYDPKYVPVFLYIT
jgi:hypothetical protein